MRHELTIHSYPHRKTRDPESRENTEHRILVIQCRNNQKEGKRPGFMRLLPDFMIRYCVIRLPCVLEAYTGSDRAPGHLERTCDLLGCMDLRTAKKHLARMDHCVRKTSIELAHTLSRTPELGEVPTMIPGEAPLEGLIRLVARMHGFLLRSGSFAKEVSLHALLQARYGVKKINDLCLLFPGGP